MPKALIKIAYRQVIYASSKDAFERKVFNDSYNEFLMQNQTYNADGKLKTFRELIANNPKANSLHYKVGFAIGLYVKELYGKIPGLYDTLNQHVSFATHRFEMIDSHTTNKLLHQVALIYETDILTLFDIAGDHFIVSAGDQTKNPMGEFAETVVIKMKPNMAVIQWQDSEMMHS